MNKILIICVILCQSFVAKSYDAKILSNQNKSINGSSFTTVGSDGCQHTTIQAAIDSGVGEVRVTQETFVENLSIVNKSVKLIGGFANCISATNNVNIIGRTTLDGNSVDRALFFSNTLNNITLEVYNFIIQNGRSGDAGFAGGLDVRGTDQTSFILSNVSSIDNNGTGLALTDIGFANFNDLSILRNSGFNGGGIRSSNSDFIIQGDSRINENTANNNGGGMYLSNNSTLLAFSTRLNNTRKGIEDNMAKKHGGGIYAESGSKVTIISHRILTLFGELGNDFSSFAVSLNIAGDNSFEADGGGVYLTGSGTMMTVNGGQIEFNSATGNGGGIAVKNNASLRFETTLEDPCDQNEFCNWIYNNSAGINNSIGGGVLAESGAQVFLGNVNMNSNKADFGSAVYSNGSSTKVTIEGSVIHHHTPSTNRDGKYILRAFTGSEIIVGFSSFALNDGVDATFGLFQADLTLAGSIIFEAFYGNSVVTSNSSTVNTHCVYTHDSSTLTGINIIQSPNTPFVDEFNSDFHLKTGSLAIDACNTVSYMPTLQDIDAQNRGFDVSESADLEGLYDMGADEFWANEIIFKDGFDTLDPN